MVSWAISPQIYWAHRFQPPAYNIYIYTLYIYITIYIISKYIYIYYVYVYIYTCIYIYIPYVFSTKFTTLGGFTDWEHQNQPSSLFKSRPWEATKSLKEQIHTKKRREKNNNINKPWAYPKTGKNVDSLWSLQYAMDWFKGNSIWNHVFYHQIHSKLSLNASQWTMQVLNLIQLIIRPWLGKNTRVRCQNPLLDLRI